MRLLILSFCILLLSPFVKGQPATVRPFSQYVRAYAKQYTRPIANIDLAGIEFNGPAKINRPYQSPSPKVLGGEIEVYGQANVAWNSFDNISIVRRLIDISNKSKESKLPYKFVKNTTIAVNKDGAVFLGGQGYYGAKDSPSEEEMNKSLITRLISKQRAGGLFNDNQFNLVYGHKYKIINIELDPRPNRQNYIFVSYESEDKDNRGFRGVFVVDMNKSTPDDDDDGPDDDDDDDDDDKAGKDEEDDNGIDFKNNSPGGPAPSEANTLPKEDMTLDNGGNMSILLKGYAGSMVLDDDGDLYIADPFFHVILKVETEDDKPWKLKSAKIIAGAKYKSGYRNDSDGDDARFNKPSGIAVDDDGNVYVADAGNNCIRKIETNSLFNEVTTFCGSLTGKAGSYSLLGEEKRYVAEFRSPMGMTYDFENDYLYVADYGNNVIRKINCNSGSNEGKVEALTGVPNPTVGGVAKTLITSLGATITKFNKPTDVGLEPKGLGLYVASGEDIVYVNLYKGGCFLVQQLRDIPDSTFDKDFTVPGPFLPITLPPGVFMSSDGSFVGVPTVKWPTTLYTVFAKNNVGWSILPAIHIMEVVCPTDTGYVKKTIKADQLPYVWNKQTLTQAGTYYANIRDKQGCDSTAKLDLEVSPVFRYEREVVLSEGLEMVPIQPTFSAGIALTEFTISPALPPGLQFDPKTGFVTGTPTQLTYTNSNTRPVTPQILPTTIAPWWWWTNNFVGVGGDITSVKISDASGNILLENKSRIGTLEGTIGKATGRKSFYSDFSAIKSTPIQMGQKYTIELKNVLEGTVGQAYSYYSDHLIESFDNIAIKKALGPVEAKNFFGNSYAICIDFNRDGDFKDPGERVYQSPRLSTTAHTETASFELPPGYSPGLTKMRIQWVEKGCYKFNARTLVFENEIDKVDNFAPYPNDSTLESGVRVQTQFLHGEFEDYSLNLIGSTVATYVIKGYGSNTTGGAANRFSVEIAGASSPGSNQGAGIPGSKLSVEIPGVANTTSNKLIDSAIIGIFVERPTFSTTNLSIRESQLPYSWNGTLLYAAGTTIVHLINKHGADSAATIILKILPTTRSSRDLTLCGTYLYNGKTILESGRYVSILTNTMGGDSLAGLNFNQLQTRFDTTINKRPADLPYYGPNNLVFTETGSKSLTFKNAAGCDSIYTVNFIVSFTVTYPPLKVFSLNQPIEPIVPVVEGNYLNDKSVAGTFEIDWVIPSYLRRDTYFSYIYPGLQFDTKTGIISGTPGRLLAPVDWKVKVNFAFAESTTNLQFGVAIATQSTSTVTNCDSYLWNGETYTSSGTYSKRFLNQYLADSTATLNLTITKPSSSENTKTVLKGQLPLIWNGQTLTAEGNYTAILKNAENCDSTTILHLILAPDIAYNAEIFKLSAGNTVSLSPTNTGGAVPAQTGIVNTFSNATSPVAIAIDSSRNTYIATLDGKLFKIGTNGTKTFLKDNLGLVNSIASDNQGNLYLAHDSKISKFSQDKSFVKILDQNVKGISLDKAGLLYYTDVRTNVVKYNLSLGSLKNLGSGLAFGYVNGSQSIARFNKPQGLTTDAEGNVFIADKSNHVIRKVNTAGIVSTYAGAASPGLLNGALNSALFNNPSSVVIDAFGNLFVVDQYDKDYQSSSQNNPIIRKISAEGIVSPLVGGVSGFANGAGLDARFAGPTSMAMDNLGYLFVADRENNAIRVINTRMYMISPALPAGLSFDASNGKISGSPLANLVRPVTFTVSAYNLAGVDSTKITLAICNPTPVSLNIDACDQYLWDGTILKTSGTYTKNYTNIGGCDSLVTLNLNIKKSSKASTVSISACDTYTWSINGKTYTETGLYYAYFTNAVGCDSTLTLDLAINICDSSTVFGGDRPMVTYPVSEKIFYKNNVYFNVSKFLNDSVIPSNAGGYVPEMIFGEKKVLMDAIDPTNRFNLDLSSGTLSSPVKDQAGNYFFIQYQQYRILKLSSDGTMSVFSGTGNSGNNDGPALQASFSSLSGEMVIDKDGNLFVGDNRKIRKITPDGIVSSVNKYDLFTPESKDGPLTDAELFDVRGLAFDKKGNLLFTEGKLGKVRKIDFSADSVTTVLSGLNLPSSIAVDIYGNIVFAEAGNHKIKKITPGGFVYTMAGNGSYSADESGYAEIIDGQDSTSQIGMAHSLSVDRNNNIYFINGTRVLTSDGVGRIGRIDGTGYVSEILHWAQNKQNNIIGVRDGKLLMYIKKQIVEINGYGYGYSRGNTSDSTSPIIDSLGIIRAPGRESIYSRFLTTTIASNAAGISKFPINLFYSNLIQINEKRTTSTLPYTWRGKTVTVYTDTITYLSPNSLNSALNKYNDTLFNLILINEAPTPTINFTPDCVNNAVVLKADGAAGNAMYFNGSNVATFPRTKNGYILYHYDNNITEIAPLKYKAFSSTAFEAWIKPKSVAGLQYIAAIDTVETEAGFMGVLINNGKLEYRMTSAEYIRDANNKAILVNGKETYTPINLVARSSQDLQAGVWTHIAAVYYDSTMYVYINGVLSGSTKSAYSFLPEGLCCPFKKDQKFTFGGLDSTKNLFTGSIDEIRWWAPKTQRTGADILANMNTLVSSSSPGLVLNYRFDDADGDSLIDNSNSNRSANLINAPVLEPSTVPINYNSYLWSPGGATTPSITSTNRQTSTKYTVTVTDYKGTAGASSVEMPVNLKSTSTETVSICASSYTWHDKVYTQSTNSATWTGKNQFGCDSVVTLNLTLLTATIPVINANVSTNLCKGGSIVLSTDSYVKYSWSNGATAQSITVSPQATTTYSVAVTDANGCTASASKTVVVVSPSASTETIVACSTYTWKGKNYTASNYTDTWKGVSKDGCDSIVTLNLTIAPLPIPVIATTNDSSVCGNGIVELTARAAGNALDFSGDGLLVMDSMGVTPASGFTLEGWVKLRSLSSAATVIGQMNGGRVLPFESYVNTDGTVSFEVGNATENSKLTSSSKLQLNKWHHLAFVYASNTMKIFIDGAEKATGSAVVPASDIVNNFIIGNRSDFNRPLNGLIDEVRVWNKARTVQEILSSMNSSVSMTSNQLTAYYRFDNVAEGFLLNAVTGQSASSLLGGKPAISSAPVNYINYLWSVGNANTPEIRTNITGTTSISVRLTDINGCTSTITNSNIVAKPSSSIVTVKTCGAYTWHDSTYTKSTNTATWVTQNAMGCDSVITLQLTISQPTAFTEKVTACDYYFWHGKTYKSTTRSATWKGINAAGCDSIVTLDLTIRKTVKSVETVVVCGSSYTWHDLTFTSANNSATWTGKAASGCDSVVTLNLQFKQPPAIRLSSSSLLNVCEGDSISLGNLNAEFAQYASNANSNFIKYNDNVNGAKQIVGKPDSNFLFVGNFLYSDDSIYQQKQSLELSFSEAKKINFIEIHESFNTGSIDSVFVKNPETEEYELVYTSKEPLKNGSRISNIQFPLTDFKVQQVKITMDSSMRYNYKSIDAVSVGIKQDLKYGWSNGSLEPTISVKTPGKYILTATNNEGCVSTDSVEIKSVVLPTLKSDSISTCSGKEINVLAPSDNDKTVYYWYRDNNDNIDGVQIEGIGKISGTILNKSTSKQTLRFTVVPVNEACIGKPVVKTVFINATPVKPIISVTGSVTVCQDENSLLTSSNSQGNQWYLDGQPITGATSSTFKAKITGNYTVQSTDANICTSEMSLPITVTVNPFTIVADITGATNVCVGATTALSNATASGIWSSASPAVATVSATGVVTAKSAGTSVISYVVTNTNGCITTVSTTVTVNALPVVANITGTASVCVGSTTALANATAMGVWSSATPSVATISATGVVTGISAGTSVIAYMVTNGNGCVTTVSTTITVNTLPVVANISGSTSVCVGSTTALSNATVSGVWSSSTPAVATVSATGVITGINAGNALISYTVANEKGCSINAQVSVMINALPVVANITGTTTVCVGSTTALSNSTASGVWSSATPTVATVSATGVVTAISAGTSVIAYTVTNANGCVTAVSTTITANALPVVANITGTSSICVGATTALFNATASGVWSSASPSVATVSATGDVTAISAGTSVMAYTVTSNGCSTTSTYTITVNALPVVANITGTTSVCMGATTTLSNATASGVWSSASPAVATVSATGVVTAKSAGTSVISYMVTANGCSTISTATVTVNTLPVVADITGDTSICVGSTSALANATALGVWNSATPSVAGVSTAGLLTGLSAGTTVISYTVVNDKGCSTTSQVLVTIKSLPAVANITGTTSLCVGSTPALANTTVSGVWSSASPTVATVGTTGIVTGLTAGTSVVSYSVTNANGCVNTVSTKITINALPVVANITGTTSICMGSTTALSNTTASGIWSSATPSVATVSAAGVVTGISAGSSVISYTVTTNGCSTTVNQTITIIGLPPTPVVIAQTYCEGAATTVLTASGSTGNTLSWYGNLATGGTGSAVAPKPSSAIPGTFNFYVSQINPSTGCESPRAKLSVIIYPTPVKATITRDATGTLLSSEASGNQWFWNDIIMVGDTLQKLKPVQSASYSIILIQNGCWGPISESYYNLITAITTLSNNEYVRLYPNPVQSMLTIDFSLNGYKQVDFKLYDMTGKLITEKKKLLNGSKINLSGLVTGMYRYQLVSSNGKILYSEKFMKD